MINYSIIIPHKNVPNLLQRCLDSIPRREDVQIIVVDDNSDVDKVDFANFPGVKDPYIEVIFDKNENGRKGAGYARNLGLGRARGKWVVFADADDFFMPCFNEVLDFYREDENDIVFFEPANIDVETGDVDCNQNRRKKIAEVLFAIQQSGNWDLAILLFEPWGKLVKFSIIETYNLLFQETPVSNDMLFAVRLATTDTKKTISDRKIYCYTNRSDSLMGHHTIESLLIRLQVAWEVVAYLKKIKKSDYLCGAANVWWVEIYRKTPLYAIKLIPQMVKNYGCLYFVKGTVVAIKDLGIMKSLQARTKFWIKNHYPFKLYFSRKDHVRNKR